VAGNNAAKPYAVSTCCHLNALLDDQLRGPLSGNAVLGGVATTMQSIAEGA
jgi:hypothetical protein